MIPDLGGDNEWDYVKFSQGKRLGEMEIVIWWVRMKYHPDHHISKMLEKVLGLIAKE